MNATSEGSGLSASDVLALDSRNNDGFGGGMGGAFWIFALLLLNNNWNGNNNGQYVTASDLAISQNAQTNTFQLQGIQQQLSENQFNIAQAIGQQTDTLINQNNTNLINAIQGFNNLGLQVTNQTNVLSSQIQNLGAQLEQCCCSIKTQMLQDRLSDAQARNVTLQNALDNANQSQYILGQLGRFVAWAGSGSQASAVTTG